MPDPSTVQSSSYTWACQRSHCNTRGRYSLAPQGSLGCDSRGRSTPRNKYIPVPQCCNRRVLCSPHRCRGHGGIQAPHTMCPATPPWGHSSTRPGRHIPRCRSTGCRSRRRGDTSCYTRTPCSPSCVPRRCTVWSSRLRTSSCRTWSSEGGPRWHCSSPGHCSSDLRGSQPRHSPVLQQQSHCDVAILWQYNQGYWVKLQIKHTSCPFTVRVTCMCPVES